MNGYAYQYIRQSAVQLMAHPLFEAQPLPKPILTDCHLLKSSKTYQVDFDSKKTHFKYL